MPKVIVGVNVTGGWWSAGPKVDQVRQRATAVGARVFDIKVVGGGPHPTRTRQMRVAIEADVATDADAGAFALACHEPF